MPGKKKDKAASKSQQRLFGMVTAYKSGKLDLDDLPPSLAKKVKGIADGKRRKTGDKRKNTKGITKKAAKELASTKHKGLPEKVKEHRTMRYDEFVNEGFKDFFRKTFSPNVEDALEKVEKRMKKTDKRYEELTYANTPYDKLESLMSFLRSCYAVLGVVEYIYDITHDEKTDDELTQEQEDYIFSVVKKIGQRYPHKMRGRLPESDIEDIMAFVKKFNIVASKYGFELEITKFNFS